MAWSLSVKRYPRRWTFLVTIVADEPGIPSGGVATVGTIPFAARPARRPLWLVTKSSLTPRHLPAQGLRIGPDWTARG